MKKFKIVKLNSEQSSNKASHKTGSERSARLSSDLSAKQREQGRSSSRSPQDTGAAVNSKAAHQHRSSSSNSSASQSYHLREVRPLSESLGGSKIGKSEKDSRAHTSPAAASKTASQAHRPLPSSSQARHETISSSAHTDSNSSQSQAPKNRRAPRKKKKSFFRRFFGAVRLVLIIALVLIAAGCWSINKQISAIKRPEAFTGDYMINEGAEAMNTSSDTLTLAIFGTDRVGTQGGRTDTIMLLSINGKTGEMSLVSVMRDTYVKIPGEGYSKINAAFSLGKAPLALQTLNKNFDLSVKDYVLIDFSSLANIVDSVGGLELKMSSEEAAAMNKTIVKTGNKYPALKTDKVTQGTHLLNGAQVLAYARIRYLGNSDFDRTARQRIVIKALLNKLLAQRNPKKLYEILKVCCSQVETTLSNKQLYKLTYLAAKSRFNFSANSLANEEHLKSASIAGASTLVPYKLSELSSDLHTLLYGAGSYTPTSALKKLSAEHYNKISQYNIETIYTGTTF